MPKQPSKAQNMLVKAKLRKNQGWAPFSQSNIFSVSTIYGFFFSTFLQQILAFSFTIFLWPKVLFQDYNRLDMEYESARLR